MHGDSCTVRAYPHPRGNEPRATHARSRFQELREMRQKTFSMCTIAVLALMAGCQSAERQEKSVTTVSVRFAMPPGVSRYAVNPFQQYPNQYEYAQADNETLEYSHTEGDTEVYTYEGDNNADYHTASYNSTNDTSYEDDYDEAPTIVFTSSDNPNYDEMNALAHAERYFVSLWGGQYKGQVVTYRDLDLTPGDYTFALWEQDPQTSVQGNLHVNHPNSALLDVLQHWQSQVPELKRRLAYHAELHGEANVDPEAFKGFKRQLSALDKLSKKINRAVWWEREWKKRNAPEFEQFVNDAVVLLLPGDEREIDPRTQPAFCASDIEGVRTGNPLTKVLVVADYETVKWKTQMVDELSRDLIACKSVLWEEVNRAERRKRILDITDHLYKHDRAFVQNEWQLQAALASIGMINDQLEDLSERRVALSYGTALTAPDEPFTSLDNEQRDLEQERVVLSAEQARLDQMWANAGPETPKRVDLEAARQRYARAVEAIDRRLSLLSDDRMALNNLRDATQVLHRQSDARVLAASIVTDSVPSRVRQAITREALMTVRLQSQDNLFAPKGTNYKSIKTASYQPYGEE
jgi:hypothetical protein